MTISRLFRNLAMLAGVALLVMMLVTVADIAMRNAFNHPIKGISEIVEIAMVVLIFLGLPEVFRTGANVKVDVINHLVGARAIWLLQITASIFALGFLAALLYAMLAPAMDSLVYVQYLQETGVPTYLLWVPSFSVFCSPLLWRRLY